MDNIKVFGETKETKKMEAKYCLQGPQMIMHEVTSEMWQLNEMDSIHVYPKTGFHYFDVFICYKNGQRYVRIGTYES